jgi:hypothetical protein
VPTTTLRRVHVPAGLAVLSLALATGACTREEADPPIADGVTVLDGVVYRVETLVAETTPISLYTYLTVENQRRDSATVSFPDGCVVLIRAYATPERVGVPAWDQQHAVACTMILVEHRLAPGESAEHRARAGTADILGDSLPDGRYFLTALVRPGGRRLEITAGEADLVLER